MMTDYLVESYIRMVPKRGVISPKRVFTIFEKPSLLKFFYSGIITIFIIYDD